METSSVDGAPVGGVEGEVDAPTTPQSAALNDAYSSGGRQPPTRGPLRAYARMVVARPWTVLLASVAAAAAAGGLVVALKAVTLSDPSDNAFLVRGDVVTRHAHALTAARNGADGAGGVDGGSAATDEDSRQRLVSEKHTMWLIVRDNSASRDALSPAALRRHKQLLDSWLNADGYEDYCWRNAAARRDCDGRVPECEPPTTVLAHPLAYGVVANGSVCGMEAGDRLLTDAEAAALRRALLTDTGQVDPVWAGVLGTDFSAASPTSRFVRSRVPMGAPLRGFDSAVKETATQDDAFLEWILPLANAVLEVDEPRGVTAKAVGDTFNASIFGDVASSDLTWSLAAIAFVFLFMAVHMRSIFLAAVAMMQIMLAFPVTFLAYSVICRVTFFSTLQVLSVFLVLGIGADDAFILADSWHQAGVALGADQAESLVDRLSWTLARAVVAMAVTSLTTGAAFFITGLSAVMPISTLGIWAGLLILMQYFLCVLMFPAALVIWQRKWRSRSWRRCLRVSPGGGTADDDAVARESAGPPAGDEPDNPTVVVDVTAGVGQSERAKAEAEAAPAAASAATAAATPVVVVVPPSASSPSTDEEGAVQAPYVVPDDAADQAVADVTEVEVVKGDHIPPASPVERLRPIERFFRGPWFRLVCRARYVSVVSGVVLFGLGIWQTVQLEPLDAPESFLPSGHYLGQGFEWLNTRFNAAADARSQSLVSVVYGIADVDRSGTSRYEPDEVGVPRFDQDFDMTSAAAQASVLAMCDIVGGDSTLVLPDVGEASCWIREFQSFVGGTFVDYPSAAALADAVSAFLVARPSFADTRLVGVDSEAQSLSWFALQFFSVTKPYDPPKVQTASRAAFEAAVSRVAASAPVGVARPYAVNDGWAFAVAQDELVLGAQRGAGLSLGVGLLVLIASTRHLYVSVLAILCVGGVVVNVLGLANLLGWRLGVSESVAATIVVGFSLDYILHMAIDFTVHSGRASGKPKQGEGIVAVSSAERVRNALTEYGVSILAGAVTSFGAATFLWAATIVFFDKFALFVQATVVSSLVWSLLIFSGGLLVLLPEEGGRWWTGDLRDIVTCGRRCWVAATGAPAARSGSVAVEEASAYGVAERGTADVGSDRGGGSGDRDGDNGAGESGSRSGGGHVGVEADWSDTPAPVLSKGQPPGVADYTVPDES
ncbi:hypothetical protein MMPV_001183 [Pyropia vietnamensis]